MAFAHNAAWTLALWACSVSTACAAMSHPPDDAPECAAAVASGEYALDVVGLLNGPSLGLGFESSGGREFAGHIDYWPPNRCDGTLTSDERDRITGELNAARLFCAPDAAAPADVYDCPAFDITVRTVDGSRTHRFCYSSCAEGMPVEGFMQALRDPIWRLWREDACAGPPYDTLHATDRCVAR